MGYNTFVTKYLSSNEFSNFSKYPVNEKNLHYHNKNTDLLCYVMMVMNMLAGEDISYLDMFLEYFNFLRDNELPYELLDCLLKIYLPGDNESPEELLDQILFCKKDFSFTSFKLKKYNK